MTTRPQTREAPVRERPMEEEDQSDVSTLEVTKCPIDNFLYECVEIAWLQAFIASFMYEAIFYTLMRFLYCCIFVMGFLSKMFSFWRMVHISGLNCSGLNFIFCIGFCGPGSGE